MVADGQGDAQATLEPNRDGFGSTFAQLDVVGAAAHRIGVTRHKELHGDLVVGAPRLLDGLERRLELDLLVGAKRGVVALEDHVFVWDLQAEELQERGVRLVFVDLQPDVHRRRAQILPADPDLTFPTVEPVAGQEPSTLAVDLHLDERDGAFRLEEELSLAQRAALGVELDLQLVEAADREGEGVVVGVTVYRDRHDLHAVLKGARGLLPLEVFGLPGRQLLGLEGPGRAILLTFDLEAHRFEVHSRDHAQGDRFAAGELLRHAIRKGSLGGKDSSRADQEQKDSQKHGIHSHFDLRFREPHHTRSLPSRRWPGTEISPPEHRWRWSWAEIPPSEHRRQWSWAEISPPEHRWRWSWAEIPPPEHRRRWSEILPCDEKTLCAQGGWVARVGRRVMEPMLLAGTQDGHT